MSGRNIEASITIGDGFCYIKCTEGEDPTFRTSQGTELAAREFSAMNAILETIRCLSLGLNIDHHFNPLTAHTFDDEKLMKLQWMRSGKICVLEEDTPRRWKHASTVDQAVNRKRSFTCTRKLFGELPKRRPSQKKLIIPGEGESDGQS